MKRLFLASLKIAILFSMTSLLALNPGTEKGEKFQIEIAQKGLENELESIEAFMQQRVLRNQLLGMQESARLREKESYEKYFNDKNNNPFNSPDDINRFSKDLIRGVPESSTINLSDTQREELLKLSSNTDVVIKESSFFKFGTKRNDLANSISETGDLYKEILELSVIDNDTKSKIEFDRSIKNSVIPFEKREIGVGLLSTNHMVKFKDFEAWATTFGNADSKDITKRGVRDIVLDRFADDALNVMKQNRETLIAAVIDSEELKKEGTLELNMGKNKIDQDMRTIETFNNTLSLTQKQVAYEGAFYAKLSEHLSTLAKTDVEDGSLFVNMFYNDIFHKDLDNPKLSDNKKQRHKEWEKWFNTLSDKQKEHFEKYLSLKDNIANNKLLGNGINFSDASINNKSFEKEPFILKQYKEPEDASQKLPDLEIFKNIEEKRKSNALKFYYETVLRKIGLDFKYEIIEIPENTEDLNAFIEKTRKGLDNTGEIIYQSSKYIGAIKWNNEDDPEYPGKIRVKHLGNPSDSEKYLENYESYLIFRLKEREKWAKIFHDLAQMMKKIAINIQSLRQGGDHYAFKWDPVEEIYTTTLEQASFKEFDGGVFRSLNDYYTSLRDAYSLTGQGLTPEALKSNLVIHEKLWKIEHYRVEAKPPNPYQEAHEKMINSRGGRKGLKNNIIKDR